MKRVFFLFTICLLIGTLAEAQKVFGTRNGKITFSAPNDDDVKAVNNEVVSRIADNGQMTFSLLMKGFKFKYAEMQEHFNDQYVESTKFPRADFKGIITNVKEVDFSKDGSYKVVVKGDLTMHGVTKNITVNGTLDIKSGKLSARAGFVAVMKEYNIDGSSVTDKVSVDINCIYQ